MAQHDGFGDDNHSLSPAWSGFEASEDVDMGNHFTLFFFFLPFILLIIYALQKTPTACASNALRATSLFLSHTTRPLSCHMPVCLWPSLAGMFAPLAKSDHKKHHWQPLMMSSVFLTPP